MKNFKKIRYGLTTLGLIGTLYGYLGKYDTSNLGKEKELITVIYNRKGETKGILSGIIKNRVHGNLNGVAIAALNEIDDNLNGMVIGAVNGVMKNLNGMALGIAGNGIIGTVTGLEVTLLLNVAGNLEWGIQVGALNYAGTTTGPYLQIGLINRSYDRWTIGINLGR